MRSTVSTSNSSERLSEHSLKQTTYRASQDAPPPRFGPGFLRFNSITYRLEMLAITIAILAILFYWRLFIVKDLNIPATIFWLIWPDIGSFIPIALATRGRKNWPSWGPRLYNLLHTFLGWIPVIVVWSILTGTIEWPLLGWAGHMTGDRSVGYYLRAYSQPMNRKD